MPITYFVHFKRLQSTSLFQPSRLSVCPSIHVALVTLYLAPEILFYQKNEGRGKADLCVTNLKLYSPAVV